MAPNNPAAPSGAPNHRPRGDVEVALDELGDKFVSEPYALADGRSVVFHAAGLKAHEIAALNPALPDFVSQRETVIEPESFIDYIRTFKSKTAICKASLNGNKIDAILDYHGAARMGDRDTALPQRQAHVVTLECPFDLDYAKWRELFGSWLKPKQLATVIEDLIHTIGTPPAADLLDAVNDFKLDRVIRFKTARNDRSGTTSFAYEEEDAEGTHDGKVTLPQEMQIIVPIFQGGMPTEIIAKIRYQMEKGVLLFSIVVPGIDQIERMAFRSIGEKVRTDTVTPVFYTA